MSEINNKMNVAIPTENINPNSTPLPSTSPLEPPWLAGKLRADQATNDATAAALRDAGRIDQAQRLQYEVAGHVVRCGDKMGVHRCGDCGSEVKVERYRCNQARLCPICARMESKRIETYLIDAARKIQTRPVYGYSWKLITLTIKTDGDYRGAVETACKAFSGLWRNYLGGRCRKNTGAYRSLEFGPKSGNVHIHVLYYGPYLPQAELSEKWEQYSGSSVVDIRRRDGDVENLVGECSKYITKFDEVEPERRVEYWQALKHKRRGMPYGLFRADVLSKWIGCKYVKPEPEPSFDIDVDLCPNCGSNTFLYIISRDPDRGPPLQGSGFTGPKKIVALMA